MNEWVEDPLPICTCGQLWKTPVDKSNENATSATFFEKDKSFSVRDPLVDSLVNAVDALAARIEALELTVTQLIGIVDSPLSPAEAIERLRDLRERMG